MLFTCDIGNSNIVCGCFRADKLVAEVRIKTDQHRTADEFRVLLLYALRHKLGNSIEFSKAIISSVVPPVTPAITAMIRDDFNLTAHVVGPGTKTGLSIRTKDPAAVGSDRIVNAVAAKELFGAPALVIDFGTAISFDYIDASNSYCGGAIAPGLEISLDALVSKTAKLPRIELRKPERIVGNDTVSAMMSGLVHGFEALVEGLIERIVNEQGEIKHVIATGGSGAVIAKQSRVINEYVPDLTLQGLRILASQN